MITLRKTIKSNQSVTGSSDHVLISPDGVVFSISEGNPKVSAILSVFDKGQSLTAVTEKSRYCQGKGEFCGIGVAKPLAGVFNARSKVDYTVVDDKKFTRENVTERTKISVVNEVVGEDVPQTTSGGQQ
jgi:hypothetical protein